MLEQTNVRTTREFTMRVKIASPDMVKFVQMDYKCTFLTDTVGYGKKTYLDIQSLKNGADHYYDLRYEKEYHKGEEFSFLAMWAENYWNGENGAYKLIECTIVHNKITVR